MKYQQSHGQKNNRILQMEVKKQLNVSNRQDFSSIHEFQISFDEQYGSKSLVTY